MDIITALLLVSLVWMGIKYNMAWLAVIGGLILVAYIWSPRGAKKPVSSGGPKVRPIIVKRRYNGPPSIYPSKMKIRVNPKWNTSKWWENAFQAAGLGVGLLAQGFSPRGRK